MDCHQASCRFDVDLFEESTAAQLGLALPALLNGAVQKRKAEFLAGRYCARAALAQLIGIPDGDLPATNPGATNLGATHVGATIGIGANREPLWPEGIVGSITHTRCYASAIVARRDRVRAIGLDSEMWIEPVSVDNVSPQILTSRERHTDHQQMFESPLHYLTLVFSAKESLFKCLFPVVNRFFDFHAALITPEPPGAEASGGFRFELLEDLNGEFRAGYCGHGSYSILATGVHTAVVLKSQGEVRVHT